MNQHDLKELANMILDANRKFDPDKLRGSVQALSEALLPDEDIELILAVSLLDGMFYDGFLVFCQKRFLFLHKQPFFEVWSCKTWRLKKVKDVRKVGMCSLNLKVKEEGSSKRLNFQADIRDHARLSNLADILEEYLDKE
jgi:hypothetical protein